MDTTTLVDERHGRHLLVCTAAGSDAEVAAASRSGRLEIVEL